MHTTHNRFYPIERVPDPPLTCDGFPDQIPLIGAFSSASLRVSRVIGQEFTIATAQYHVKVASYVPANQLLCQVLATLRCHRIAFPIACSRLGICSCEVFRSKLVWNE